MSKYRTGAPTTNPTLLKELKRSDDIVAPAAKKAHDYLDWFMDEIQTNNPQTTMSLVIQHVDDWGIVQAILAELDSLDTMLRDASERTASKTLLGKSKISQDTQRKTKAVRSVFMAELLREVFIKDTNFKEVVYGEK